jgi:hypothetical protein
MFRLAFALVLVAGSAVASEPTCTGYLSAMKTSKNLGDWVDVAEGRYGVMNDFAAKHGLAVLPLPEDTDGIVERARGVYVVCQRDKTLTYREAVAQTYVVLRIMSGLPVKVSQ